MVVLDTKHMETYQLYMTPIIIIGVPVGSYHHENSTFPSRSSSQRLLLCKQKIAALSKDGCSEQNILSALPAEGKLIKLKYFQIIFSSSAVQSLVSFVSDIQIKAQQYLCSVRPDICHSREDNLYHIIGILGIIYNIKYM